MKKLLFLLLIIPFINHSQEVNQPIIDMHLHDYTEQTYFTALSHDGIMSPKDYQTYKKELLRVLKELNIQKAVVSTIGGPNKLDDNGVLIPGYYTSSPPKDTIAFKKLIESGELKVFGEIGAQYRGLTLSDPAFDPYLSICERYDIPVAIHSGAGPNGIAHYGAPKFRLNLGDPFLIEDALVKHPKLRVYVMHAGAQYYQNMLMLMSHYENVYADLGILLWASDATNVYAEYFLKMAKRMGLIDKIMFGSDQMVWPHAIEKSINQLNSYDFLTEEDKKKIFYDNAAKFLKLE